MTGTTNTPAPVATPAAPEVPATPTPSPQSPPPSPAPAVAPGAAGAAPGTQPSSGTTLLGDLPKAGGPDQPATAPAPNAAPYELKPPTDFNYGAKAVSAFAETGKALGVPAEQAQKLLDSFAKADVAHRQETIRQFSEAGRKAIETHPTLGGDRLPQSKQFAAAALRYASPKLMERLRTTPLGNDPVVFEFLATVGQKLAPDTPIVGGGEANNPGPASARTFFGKSPELR
jgi:hypothetical protein